MKNQATRKTILLFIGISLIFSIRCGTDANNKTLLASAVARQCQPGMVTFDFSSSEGTAIPEEEPVVAIISIANPLGQVLYNQEELVLNKINGEFISAPIKLLPGSYHLNQFIAIGADGEALLAAPRSGSELADQVSNPLSISFAVSGTQETSVTTQVVSTAGSTAVKFGYAQFSFNIIDTLNFLIGVLIYNPDIMNYEMTTSTMTVKSGSKNLFNNTIPAENTPIRIHDGYSSYSITVTKKGYKKFTRQFTNAELKAFTSTPLVVILE